MVSIEKINNTKKSKRFFGREKKKLLFYVLIMALPVIQFCIFYLYMNINSILLAFRRYDIASNQYKFVAFDNFKRVFTGDNGKALSEVMSAIGNSLLVFGTSILIGVTFGLVFAFAIYKKVSGSGFFKVILFMPHVVSIIVMVIIYKYFVSEALPSALPWFTKWITGEEKLGLLSSRNIQVVLGTILFFAVFTGFGTSMLMYTGAMSGISDSVVEAAKIDGITPFKEFIYITVPSIYPTLVTFIVLAVAGIFTNQMHLYSFYGDGADTRLSTLGYYLYKYTLKANGLSYPQTEYPYLSAFGLVLTVIAVPLTLVIRKLLERFGPSTE